VLLRILAAATVAGSVGMTVAPAFAANYVPISGSGSTWSQNAIDQWARDGKQLGFQINYAGTGSSDGRNQFRSGTVDFAVSEIPYGITQGGNPDPLPTRSFAYMPIVAGGTSLMYNLRIGGRMVTNLRLSNEAVAKIFTGVIKQWNDPLIAKDNPGLTLPARRVVPVVRSDGSGTTAQFSTYLASQQASLWNAYCGKAGLPNPCGTVSQYPVLPGSGFTAQAQSLGVAGYVSQANNIGTITYVEYSYAKNAGFPVAKLLNRAGYYIEPTASSVAVALTQAKIRADLTSDLTSVYTYSDPRTYPMSSYSYMIVPTSTASNFSNDKGRTLAAFAKYFLCEGQKKAPLLGYSPLPINLVQAGFAQVKRIPGADVTSINIASCDNPTFSKSGGNLLAKTAPQPKACDKAGGVSQCPDGTGGAARVPTAVKNGSTGGSGGGGSGTTGGTTGNGGGGTSGTNGGGGTSGTTGGGATPGTNGGTGTDPLTGTTDGGSTTTDGTSVDTQNVAAANPITIGTGGGASSPTFAILAILALVGVVVLPPLVFGVLRRGGSA
jgi:phosphate ABC transporter phosphate-binding protein